MAQVETDFSAGGGVRIGDSSTACYATIEGALRFDADGADTIDYCNGTTWLTLLSSAVTSILDGGNSTGAALTIGTNDNFALNFETNDSTAMTIDSSGNVGIGTSTPIDPLEVAGNISATGGGLYINQLGNKSGLSRNGNKWLGRINGF